MLRHSGIAVVVDDVVVASLSVGLEGGRMSGQFSQIFFGNGRCPHRHLVYVLSLS